MNGSVEGFITELSNINRKLVLAICCFGWSTMTLLSGFATMYWHVCVARVFLGVL
jgi:predicted MFS family arabinose efflux permease